MATGTVTLQQIIKKFNLEVLYTPKDPTEVHITKRVVNRPALPLTGFFEHFESERIQIIGSAEHRYLESLEPDVRKKHINDLFSHQPPALIYTHGMPADEFALEAAKEYGVSLLSMEGNTSEFMAALIAYLNVQLAQTITRHGVLVEVYGEGILIVGDSGVGKSETAIELVNRGHRLIADDAVEIRRVSSKSLVGTSPENIRHFIELRGIGIINASRIFGVGAVKPTEKIDLVINIEPWDSSKVYDRMGLEDETTEILGINLPSITVPVKPGRNLAVIIEVAARNNRQKKLGYNAAQALLERLGMSEAKSNNANDKTGYSDF